jgi:hypothetical protein
MNAEGGRGNVMFGVDWTKRGFVNNTARDWRSEGWYDEGSISGGFLQVPAYRAGANVDARFPSNAEPAEPGGRRRRVLAVRPGLHPGQGVEPIRNLLEPGWHAVPTDRLPVQ